MKITKKLKKIEEKLRKLAQADYKHPVVLEARIEPGPFGIYVMTVCYPKAHPGTGMRRVLIDEEMSYGRHGDHDVGVLLKNKNLLTTNDAQQLLRLVNIAYFDGIALLVNPDPRISRGDGKLELRFFRTLHPSGQKILVTFTVGESQSAQLMEKAG